MKFFDKFKELNIDLSPVGFERASGDYTYFCTPAGARILGRAGVDGIHYCAVRGFGETVFAVCPMNLPGEYVRPVAKSFEDLLRLLLACGDMAAIDQAGGWDRAGFERFLRENEPAPEAENVLRELEDKLGLAPMEDPFGYIKALQAGFDYGKLRFSREYYEVTGYIPAETAGEWRVFYDCGYSTKAGRARPGKELRLDRQFAWGEELWHVPAVYLCTKGLVAEFCIEIDPARVRAYLDKWAFSEEDGVVLTREQREMRDRENPMNVDFRPILVLNGAEVTAFGGSGTSWAPESLLPEGTSNDLEGTALMEHYGLDRSRAWSFFHWSFPWPKKKRPKITSLGLKLSRDLSDLDGIRFQDPAPGDVFTFTHPLTGAEHRLTVLSVEPRQLDADLGGEYELPTHFQALSYTLEPDLPQNRFQVRDVLENEEPRPRKRSSNDVRSAAIGIIGGIGGPIAVTFARRCDVPFHNAMSALRFAPAASVEWRAVFREKLLPDVETELIGGPGTV